MKMLPTEVVSKMTPEKRQQYEKKLNIIKRNRALLKGALALIFIVAVISAVSVIFFFKISDISVKEEGMYYTSEEIILNSGLEIGDSLMFTDFNKASEKVRHNLPYVKKLNIKKALNGKVVLSVVDDCAATVFTVKNGYVFADAENKALEFSDGIPEKNNFMIVKTKSPVNAEIGGIVTLANDEETELYNTVISGILKSGLKGITGIDISNPSYIYVEYQHRFRLNLGNATDINKKFKEAVKIIKMEDENDPNAIGEINLTILKKVYVKPLDSLDETENEDITSVTTEPEPEEIITDESDEIEKTTDEEETTEEATEETEADGENTEESE